MEMVKAKRIRHFLRLTYPIRVVLTHHGFKAEYPDLPGCCLVDPDLPRLYARLEQQRRQWIAEKVLVEEPIPLPNTHLQAIPHGVPERLTTQDVTPALS